MNPSLLTTAVSQLTCADNSSRRATFTADSIEEPAGKVCPLCGETGFALGFRDGHYLRECRCTGRVLLSWQWDDTAHYEQLYRAPHRYHTACQQAGGQLPSVERDLEHLRAAHCRLRQLQLFIPRGTVLDIGAGTGAFVEEAIGFGYTAEGLEISPDMIDWARAQGRRVAHGTWREARPAWSVITLHDVWEHLTAPQECLEHLRDCLEPEGMLVIELPEWHCPQAQAAGLAWRHIRPEQHIWLPDETAARAMFERAGLILEAMIRPLRGSLGKATYYLKRE